MVQGSIPEKIVYVYSSEENTTIGCPWDHYADIKQETVSVLPAMVVDATNKKTMVTAENWAANSMWNKLSQTVHKKECNNVIKDITLCRLEHRGNSGRAYKVIVDGYYVDLREDVLVDIMLNSSITNGKISGEFIWARVNSEMKIVRKNSELYKQLVKAEVKKEIKPFKNSEFEVGGEYETRSGSKLLFLGFADTFKLENINDKNLYNRVYDSKTYKYTYPIVKDNFKSTKKNNVMVFYKIDYKKFLLDETEVFYYDLKKSHTIIKKIKNTKIDSDIIDQIRIRMRLHLANLIKTYKNDNVSQNIHSYIECYSELINLYPVGQNNPVFDYKSLIPFA